MPALRRTTLCLAALFAALSAARCSTQPASPPAAPALHNLHSLTPNLISGAVPEGDAAFDELQALGVKTIISVDGATPDLARARARNIRYIHIPITYATITQDQTLLLAKALRDLPGPIFIHCHHGKHRGPAAAAAAAIALGQITPAEGTAFMQKAGTAPNYTGLYACIAAATPAPAVALDNTPSDFPEAHQAQGIVAAMIEVDLAFEHLTDIRAAGWQTPPDHPDLVPAAEAGRLTNNLRLTAEDTRATAEHGDDYTHLLLDSIAKASNLEELLVRSAPAANLEAAYKHLQASCNSCHTKYRDQ
jgi:protein tyrosine phosphatase (PTP) superfamily phosphohydrolase (DUF442 family)